MNSKTTIYDIENDYCRNSCAAELYLRERFCYLMLKTTRSYLYSYGQNEGMYRTETDIASNTDTL